MICLLPEMSLKIILHLVNFKSVFKIQMNCCFICEDKTLYKVNNSLPFAIMLPCVLGFPDDSGGKESACNAGDPGSISELGRSPGEGNGYPL